LSERAIRHAGHRRDEYIISQLKGSDMHRRGRWRKNEKRYFILNPLAFRHGSAVSLQ
jgi:hypothetical protein